MKKALLKIIMIAAILAGNNLSAKNPYKLPKGFSEKTEKKISFTENKGQVHDQNFNSRPDVLYSGNNEGFVFHLKNNSISYQLFKVDCWKEIVDERTNRIRKEIDKNTVYRLDINWLNANTKATIVKGKAIEGYNNYYLENCPNGALNVQSYEAITYQNIYNGIDLKWYQKDGHLKYDYMVAAGANYKTIQLEVRGAIDIKLSSRGELIINTPLGSILEQAPLVIQDDKELKSRWLIKNNIVSFEIENINPGKAFVIDPAVRVWGTLYGENGSEGGNCATDVSGNVYLSGSTDSNNSMVMATVGAHQSNFGGGNSEAYLIKFNTNGVRQWATYYGGNGDDGGSICSTDANSNVYMAGGTSSTNGMVIGTLGAHQSNFGGRDSDAFLVKFNKNGVRQWGTYYGGSGNDAGFCCTTDVNGNVFLAGITDSYNGTEIATSGAHQSTAFLSGTAAFLAKFDSSGIRQWGTYYGGDTKELPFSCATDAAGNVFLMGDTYSIGSTLIATTGAHQTLYGGNIDAFLVKFNKNGVRQWGTYYGADGNDRGNSCATDINGNVYITGATNSASAIATSGAHQFTLGGGEDAFLVKFNTNGVRQWGTYYGGTYHAGSGSYDLGKSCATDAYGYVYMAGTTESSAGTVIATPGEHQPTFGGTRDAFLVKFNPSGDRQWGTYYGASTGSEYAGSCAISTGGFVYLSGDTDSNTGTVIATTGAHQTVFGGIVDAFLVKFSDSVTPTQIVDTSLDKTEEVINIYPNPFNSRITIVSNTLNKPVYVYNAIGSLVFTDVLKNEQTQIDLTQVTNGVYLIKVGAILKKVIKE